MHEDGRKGASGDRKKEKTLEGRKKGRERGDRKGNKITMSEGIMPRRVLIPYLYRCYLQRMKISTQKSPAVLSEVEDTMTNRMAPSSARLLR